MSKNKKKILLGREILFNKLGQIFLKKRLIAQITTKFFRYISRGL
jgi:hypothetical protein